MVSIISGDESISSLAIVTTITEVAGKGFFNPYGRVPDHPFTRLKITTKFL
jgi:hypothetical protein